MVARVIPVDPFDLVIFGATGDLARRKILPALCRRFGEGQMPEDARIIGAQAKRSRWQLHRAIAPGIHAADPTRAPICCNGPAAPLEALALGKRGNGGMG